MYGYVELVSSVSLQLTKGNKTRHPGKNLLPGRCYLVGATGQFIGYANI